MCYITYYCDTTCYEHLSNSMSYDELTSNADYCYVAFQITGSTRELS
jgi:hypothetical protein